MKCSFTDQIKYEHSYCQNIIIYLWNAVFKKNKKNTTVKDITEGDGWCESLYLDGHV